PGPTGQGHVGGSTGHAQRGERAAGRAEQGGGHNCPTVGGLSRVSAVQRTPPPPLRSSVVFNSTTFRPRARSSRASLGAPVVMVTVVPSLIRLSANRSASS